jgi:outer membrane protein assembly factor BamA
VGQQSCCWVLPIFVASAGLAHVECQQVTQSSKVSYDGQQVAKVSVDALCPLVQQKAGEAYSTSKVESTISALKGTGKFSKVELDVKPDPGGLQLTFTLEPVLYFGIFQFPGTTSRFTYTRLLQVIDIPNQTPYKQELVAKAGDALLQFFISAGYFRAQVQPEPQFDETHMLANVAFHVNLGKRAKVGSVEVRGPEPGEANRLLHATRSLRATARGASLKRGVATAVVKTSL